VVGANAIEVDRRKSNRNHDEHVELLSTEATYTFEKRREENGFGLRGTRQRAQGRIGQELIVGCSSDDSTR
jgi:hypothetical protein